MPNSEIDLPTFDELKQMSGDDFIDELWTLSWTTRRNSSTSSSRRSIAGTPTRSDGRRTRSSPTAPRLAPGACRTLRKQLEMLGKEDKLAETGDRLNALEQAYQAAASELKGLKA